MRRMICAMLIVSLCLLGGCSAFLEKEYLTITDYDSATVQAATPDISAISSYDMLLRALEGLVDQHKDSAQLQFSGYAGSISDDMAEACAQVKSSTDLGAYMVNYISYDISRIVTYYQATVYINYTRTAEEMEAIHSIGADRIGETVVAAVSEGRGSVAMRLYTAALDSAAMAQRAERALLEAPAQIPVLPEIEVAVYSGTGQRQIFELEFDYRIPGAEIPALAAELRQAVVGAAKAVSGTEPRTAAQQTARYLWENCALDQGAERTTAYDVLVAGKGDSRAVAMAYAAVYAEKGLPVHVIGGLKNNARHFWALVQLGEDWYHADAAEAMEIGELLLRTDAEMMRTYRWDELDYPAAVGPSLLAERETAPQETPPLPEQPTEETAIPAE